MNSAHEPQVTSYLRRDALKHIVHLKALESYSRHICSHYFSEGSSAGVLFVYPTGVTTYESVKYPQTEHVVLIASESPSVTERMLDCLPRDGGFVIKLMSAEDKDVVARRYPLERITSFLSYTSPAGATFARSKRVLVSCVLDEKLLPFFRQNGYERDEVGGYFSSRSALSFALEENGEPVSACLACRNYGEVWEICGLYTAEPARRKGYARKVVETALDRLLANGYVPRYQMDESNLASRELAERLGLTRFLATEHFVSKADRLPAAPLVKRKIIASTHPLGGDK
jgi:GNAT superfamily N-acetyltransferase